MIEPPPAALSRHRLARAIEHPVQVDGDAAVPIFRPDVLDLRGRPGDAGIVHEHVEAAEVARHVGEQTIDVL